jgi:hypothetical protein
MRDQSKIINSMEKENLYLLMAGLSQVLLEIIKDMAF